VCILVNKERRSREGWLGYTSMACAGLSTMGSTAVVVAIVNALFLGLSLAGFFGVVGTVGYNVSICAFGIVLLGAIGAIFISIIGCLITALESCWACLTDFANSF